MTLRKGKILILPVRNRIVKAWDTVFELMQIEAQCNKNHFTFFLLREVGASERNIDLEQEMFMPKINKKW